MKLLILLALLILNTQNINIAGYPILIFQSNETFIQAVNIEHELKLNDKHPNYTFITSENLDYLKKIFNLTHNDTEDDTRRIHRKLLFKQHHELTDHSTAVKNENYFKKQRNNLAIIMNNLHLMIGLMMFIILSSFYAVFYYTNNLLLTPQQSFKFIVLIHVCYITLIILIAYFD